MVSAAMFIHVVEHTGSNGPCAARGGVRRHKISLAGDRLKAYDVMLSLSPDAEADWRFWLLALQ
jgi:hypothetical protein